MRQLHTSYSNLQSWKILHDNMSVHVKPNLSLGIYISLSVIVFCALGVLGLLSQSPEGNIKIVILFLGLTGIVVPSGILIWLFFEWKKGELMNYEIRNDLLNLPRNSLKIESASHRVSFSFEHYTDNSDHFFELNLVLDGRRRPFLSSSVKNGFNKVLDGIRAMGFRIEYNKLLLK